jgi:iron complex transport system substrate-binding protein
MSFVRTLESRSLLIGTLVLAACAGPPPATRSGPAVRIVSLAPSSTEILYALDAGPRIVGVCAECDQPPEAAKAPRVGGYLSPSVEAVLGVAPDLVVAVPSPETGRAVARWSGPGPRARRPDRTLADLWASIRVMADAIGAPEAGARLTAAIEQRLGEVRTRVGTLPKRSVLVVVGHSPLVVVGGGTLQDELIALAGGVNVAADAGDVWPTISLEVVVARAEVIVDAAMGAGGRPCAVRRPPTVRPCATGASSARERRVPASGASRR